MPNLNGNNSTQRIGTVIVTFNNATMLRSLLEDLLSQTRKPDEIIVIDNASSDDTEAMIKEYPHFRYIKFEENLGSAGGYYEGLKTACENNDFVWTLDDDMSLNENALEVLERWWYILEKNGQLGAVRSWVGHVPDLLDPIKINSFAWRGTFIKKEVIQDVGLPLKEYFLYAEDDEYGHRITKKGYNMFFIPESQITEMRIEDKMIFNVWGKRRRLYKDKFRFYYAFRNQIDLYLRYKEFYNLIKTFSYAIKVIFLIIFLKHFKGIGIIKAVLDGIWDGLSSNLGKNQKYLPYL